MINKKKLKHINSPESPKKCLKLENPNQIINPRSSFGMHNILIFYIGVSFKIDEEELACNIIEEAKESLEISE